MLRNDGMTGQEELRASHHLAILLLLAPPLHQSKTYFIVGMKISAKFSFF